MTIDQLINTLKIEEANRLKDKANALLDNNVKANVVETSDKADTSKSPRCQNKNQMKFNKGGQYNNNKNKIQKKRKDEVCFVYGKQGNKSLSVLSLEKSRSKPSQAKTRQAKQLGKCG